MNSPQAILHELLDIATRYQLDDVQATLQSLPSVDDRCVLLLHPVNPQSVDEQHLRQLEAWLVDAGADSVRRDGLPVLKDSLPPLSSTAIVIVFQCGEPLRTTDLGLLANLQGQTIVPHLVLFTGAEKLTSTDELNRIERGIRRTLGNVTGQPAAASMADIRAGFWSVDRGAELNAQQLREEQARCTSWIAEALVADRGEAQKMLATEAIDLTEQALRDSMANAGNAKSPEDSSVSGLDQALADVRAQLEVRLDDDTRVLLNEVKATSAAERNDLAEDVRRRLDKPNLTVPEMHQRVEEAYKAAAERWARSVDELLAKHVDSRRSSIEYVLSGGTVDWVTVNRVFARLDKATDPDERFPVAFQIGNAASLNMIDEATSSGSSVSGSTPGAAWRQMLSRGSGVRPVEQAARGQGRHVGFGVGGALGGYVIGLGSPFAVAVGGGIGLLTAEIADRLGSHFSVERAVQDLPGALATTFGEKVDEIGDALASELSDLSDRVAALFVEIEVALLSADQTAEQDVSTKWNAELSAALSGIDDLRTRT